MCCTGGLCRNHYISPQQFAANVDRIIQKAKAVGVKHFLIISPPPVCEVCKKDKPVRLLKMGGGGEEGTAWNAGQADFGSSRSWWWGVSRSLRLWMATHASSSIQSTQQHLIAPELGRTRWQSCGLLAYAETLGPGERPQQAVC